jgi:hypothetical protein
VRVQKKTCCCDDLICAWIYFACTFLFLLFQKTQSPKCQMEQSERANVSPAAKLCALAQMSERSHRSCFQLTFFLPEAHRRLSREEKKLLCLQLPKLLWFFNGQKVVGACHFINSFPLRAKFMHVAPLMSNLRVQRFCVPKVFGKCDIIFVERNRPTCAFTHPCGEDLLCFVYFTTFFLCRVDKKM